VQRFYLGPELFNGNYILVSDKKFINQLLKVLRAKEGDRFSVFDNSGLEYAVQLITLGKNEAKFLIIDRKRGICEPHNKLTLYPSLLKSDKFEWMLQKATELGVEKIVPVVSKRCTVNDLSAQKMKTYLEIIKEATEQCGGCVMTKLESAVSFNDAVQSVSTLGGAKLIAWEEEMEASINSKLVSVEEAHIFIGPEGGYEKEEIQFALKYGIKPVTLGKRILRAETASVFIASLYSNRA
jgi:16S rRNA (uracil1498-N3)-methyltransferase